VVKRLEASQEGLSSTETGSKFISVNINAVIKEKLC
jgi:hypothetical protein